MNSRHSHSAAVSALLACLLGALAAPGASGQVDPPLSDDPVGVQSPAWELADPVNRAEVRIYFALMWEAEALGVPVPAFAFTNVPPCPSRDHCDGNNYLPESVRQDQGFAPPLCRPHGH